MKNKELTPTQRKKKQLKQTRLRVKKYREKKKEDGFKPLNLYISPENMETLDRYKSMKYMDRFSYSYIIEELINTILKRRNTAMFHQGKRWAKKNIKKDKYDF
jgi:hypothetical protein